MKKCRACLILISVLPFMASCSTASVSDGAGYASLHPSAATRTFIFENDRPFTLEVAAHNTQCSKDKMCRK